MRLIRILAVLAVLACAGLAQAVDTPDWMRSTTDFEKLAADHLNSPDKTYLYIEEDTTWEGEVHVGGVRISNGAVLTIMPGTTVHVSDDASIVVYDGLILASAPDAETITFKAEEGADDWFGMMAVSNNGVVAAINVNNAVVENAVASFYMMGPMAILVLEDLEITGSAMPVLTSNEFAALTNVSADGGQFIFVDGGTVTGCTIEGEGIFQGQNTTFVDCRVTGSTYGFTGWGTFIDCSAMDCQQGFGVQGGYLDYVSYMENCWVRRCERGFELFGGFHAERLKVGEASEYGIKVRAVTAGGQACILDLVDSKIVNSTGIGLLVSRPYDGNGRANVTNTYFENNATHVLAEATEGDICSVNLGQNGVWGHNQFIDGPNTVMDIENQTALMLYAEGCYWDQPAGVRPDPDLIGPVDFMPYIGDPNDPYDPNDPLDPNNPTEGGLTAKPNPFNPQTTFAFSLPRAGHVRLVVHDMRGRIVRTLVDGREDAGQQSVEWNGSDDAGRRVATGTYFARAEHAGGSFVQKVSLVK